MAGRRANIYISEENLEKWDEITRKSEWVNDLLTGDVTDLERKIRRVVEQVLTEKESGY